MKELKELLAKLEAMSLSEFNDKVAKFIKNSETIGKLKKMVADFQSHINSDDWKNISDNKNYMDYDNKFIFDPDNLNHIRDSHIEWKNAWGDWSGNKDS